MTHITKDQSEARKAEVPETEALKPCPFCGNPVSAENTGIDMEPTFFDVDCLTEDCPLNSISICTTAKAWNARAAELSAPSSTRCEKCENWIETVESICGTCGWNPKINDYGEGITSAQESKPFGYITAFAAKSLAELEGSILSVSLTVSGECNGLTDTPLYLAAPSVSAQDASPKDDAIASAQSG
jgi:hypothetical protein